MALGFGTGADHLARAEYESGRLGLLQTIDKPRKLFRAIFDARKDPDDGVQVDLLFERRRRDDILYVDKRSTFV